jgi:SNF2 family DNA or RNA helicase
MLKVQSHPRGLAISALEGADINVLLRRLDEHTMRDEVKLHRGLIILPISLAGEVFTLLKGEKVSWDEYIFTVAQKQCLHREKQLRARTEVAGALEHQTPALIDSDLTARLDAHQISAVAAITVPSLRGLALFDEQGTGKTIIALASFDRLRSTGNVQRLLVVAPKSVLGVWQSDCRKLLESKYVVANATGPMRNRRRAIQSQHDILLVSYETAVRELGLIKMTVAADPSTYMLVVDESYFIKNSKTNRSRAIAIIRPFCERAIALCGSPAPNSPLDVVNQVDITDGGVAFAGRVIPKERHAASVEVKKGLDQAIYLRRLKEEVLPEIPAKHFERVFIDLQPVQKAMYLRVRDELITLVRNTSDREFLRHLSTFLAKRSALLQICSNPTAVDPLYTEVPAKLLALDQLLNELINNENKKVIIWSFFRSSLQAISDRYRQYGLVRIDGSVVKVEDRIEAIHRFQNDDDVRLFVGNAAAAGAGITLTASHHAIYESFSNQAAHYMQSVDRIHRRGQAAIVTNHVLLTSQTIEIKEFDLILQKEENARDLLGDSYKSSTTRTRFLTDLGA